MSMTGNKAQRLQSLATMSKVALRRPPNERPVRPGGLRLFVAHDFSRRVTCRAALALIFMLCMYAPTALAQTNASDWSRLGALSATAHTLAADPSNPSSLYALGPDGISHSTDAGATWAVCNRNARYMRVVTPLKGQAGPILLYAAGPGGLRQSTDGCATWKDVQGQGLQPSSGNVRWLATYPDNNPIVYAGMDGLGGLYRSTDAGAAWQPASKGLPTGAWATAFTADPRRPERVFVGLRYASRHHPPAYVYKSTDGGLTWRSSSLGLHVLPNNGGSITGLAWSGDILLAATSSDGLYASTDRGESWQKATMPRRTDDGPRLMLPGSPNVPPMPLRIDGLMANTEGALLLNTPEGVFRSIDGARTWQGFGPSGSTGGKPLLVSMDPNSGQIVLSAGKDLWGYKMPSGVVSLPVVPTPTVAEVAQQLTPPPTPPASQALAPPLPVATQAPTQAPTRVVPTATAVARPPGYLPSDKAEPLDPAVSDYFPQTGHNIKFGFRTYWLNHGGAGFLGYPLTEEFVENGVTMQYFERVRLEYRDDKIVWGLLGTELTAGHFYQTVRFFPSEDNNVYFGPTQHSASGPFLTFWRDNGGLATFGFPLSESFKEDGSEYQWFERARFEWHPYLPEGKRIVLGLIGKEALQKRGWIK